MKKGMKLVVLWAVILTMVMSLIGCGAKEETKSGGSTTKTETKTEDKKEAEVEVADKGDIPELSIMMPASWYKEGWKAIDEDINARAEELGFKLVFDKMPEGDEGRSLAKVRFASGEFPDFYCHGSVNIAVSEFKGDDFFEDISGSWTDHYNKKDIESIFYSNDDKVMGVPVGGSILFGGFYNEELFAELNITPPTNWDELLVIAQVLKDAGKVPVYISGKDAWTIQWPVRNAMVATQDAQEVFDKINTNQAKYVDNADFKDGLEKTKALIDAGFVNETYLTDTFDDAQRALVNGDAGMYFLGTWTVDEIAAKFPDDVDKIRGFPTPFVQDAKVLIGYPETVLMTSGIQDKELGMKFIDYLTSEETQKMFFEVQPGATIYQGIETDMQVASRDLLDIYNMDGRGDVLPNKLIKYNWGNMSPFADYFIGSLTAEETMETLDIVTEKNAKAASDANWE